MKEGTIADFLAGLVGSESLAAEIAGSQEKVDAISTRVTVEGLKTEFLITRAMALRFCESVLGGRLQPDALRLIAFVIVTSDHLTWGEDELLGEILHDWSCPEVNYPLTDENMTCFRRWLQGTDLYRSKPGSPAQGKLLSRLIRRDLPSDQETNSSIPRINPPIH